jgi:hypothetical protein
MFYFATVTAGYQKKEWDEAFHKTKHPKWIFQNAPHDFMLFKHTFK